MTDDPQFFAWLDGELDAHAATAMAVKVAADPALAALAEQHRALGASLRGAFAPIAAAPLPDRLRAAATPALAPVIDLAEARARRRRQWSLGGLAMAASLALGLAIGITLQGADTGSFSSQGSQLAAAGALDRALDRQLASAGEVGGVRLGLSFRGSDGRYCRSFTQPAGSGLACRAGGDWRIEGLVAGERPAGDYRMASGTDPALATLIDQRLGGDPLGPIAEKAARDRDWR